MPAHAESRRRGRATARPRLFVGAALLFLAGSVPFSAPLRAQVGVTPAVLELAPEPSSPGLASIRVMADSTEQTLRIYVGDWDRGPNGENRFFAAGSLPGSCSPHIRVFPDAVTVGPGHDAVVQVVLDSLPDPMAACWSIVFAETQPAATGGAIRIIQRVGTKVYGLPRIGLTREAVVEGIRVSEDRPRVAIDFHNLGSAPLDVTGTLEVRSLEGAAVSSLPIEPFPILPGARQTVDVPLAETPSTGAYLALAIFDFGGVRRVAGQAIFEAR